MKKIIKFFIMFVTLFGFINAYASTCSYSEQASLNKEVANIKVSYEEKTGKVDPSLYDCQVEDDECVESEYNYFTISILNMSKNFYVEVYNNVEKGTQSYSYNNANNGIITFDYDKILKIATFTFKVYASSETNCNRELYRTIYLTTPRKNVYYYYAQCSQYPDSYLCQKYVTFEEMSFNDFMGKMDKYIEEQENKGNKNRDNDKNHVLSFFEKNKILIISIAGAAVLAGGVTAVIVIKKRRSRAI